MASVTRTRKRSAVCESSSPTGVRERVENLLIASGLDVRSDNGNNNTKTKAGWCLLEGLCHIGSANDGLLLPRILHHGVPGFYLKRSTTTKISGQQQCRHEATQDLKDPQTCFQSLCRIIAGQFVSGKSAQAAWKRLLTLDDHQSLTPATILAQKKDMEKFQKVAGVTKAKARSILDLAERFADQRLSEEMLVSSSEETVRKALMQVKGIGAWSCDMFLLFYLERPNILPLGDLGVRKGISSQFSFQQGSAVKQKIMCPKKDANKVRELLRPYDPYFSLLSYYMWRVADTPDAKLAERTRDAELQQNEQQQSSSTVVATTPTKRQRRRSPQVVTP